jgi:hypothetical protein
MDRMWLKKKKKRLVRVLHAMVQPPPGTTTEALLVSVLLKQLRAGHELLHIYLNEESLAHFRASTSRRRFGVVK